MNRYVMGIQSYANKDSGAALIRFDDAGRMLDWVAISEERLIRRKHPYTFPLHSIDYCLSCFGLESLDSVDLLVTDHIRVKRWFQSGPAYLIGDFDYMKMKFAYDPDRIRITGHHTSHAATAYYTSPFDDAAVLIVDGNGSDLETTSYYRGRGTDLSLIENYKHHGVGNVYAAISSLVLNFGTGGEGKTMGLAPFGEKHPPVMDLMPELNGIEHSFSHLMQRMPYSDVLNHTENDRIDPLKFDYRRAETREQVLEPYFARIAFEVQQMTETVLIHLAEDLHAKTGCTKLCVAGGVGLNSVTNKLILDRTPFDDIFIFPACSDAGIPFGLALWGYYNLEEFAHVPHARRVFAHAYTGRAYDRDETLETLQRYGIAHRPLDMGDVAARIAEGDVVGWHQGGSEYGPRALGHRSILADARRPDMADRVNVQVKHRETFRPFAPAVLEEATGRYFDLDRPSPFMLLVCDVHDPESVPAITHVDGTARVQTVTAEENGRFYDLIKAFGDLTGVPCIMNTSFNDAGEPIVETPLDALICSLNTQIDLLVIGDFVIETRDHRDDERIARMIADRKAEIAAREARLIARFCPGYDADEKDRFLTAANAMSAWHARYRAKYELEKAVLEAAAADKTVLIVGTRDHTRVLYEKINGFNALKVAGFMPWRSGAEREEAALPWLREVPWTAFDTVDYDVVLVSSYEWQFDIVRALERRDPEMPMLTIYDNSSRNLMDVVRDLPAFPVPSSIAEARSAGQDVPEPRAALPAG